MAEISLGNLYDFNKQAMAQFQPLDPIQLNIKLKEVCDNLYNESLKGKPYWMLLSNERKDYTLFIVLTSNGICAEMLPTLQNRGQVLTIDKQEDGNYEIWIRDPETKENFVYYLFDYGFGIIKA
jgi:hypothetical protein